ncbi:MAG: hypothetical protein MdMp014T_0732 [Treponematales bacterium]
MDEREKQAREAVKLLADYVGVRRCAEIGLPDHPEKAAKDFDEAVSFLKNLFSALCKSVNNMERDLKALRGKISFEIEIAIAKEIGEREKMLGQVHDLIALLKDERK